jgi:hypothetical protein
VPKLDWGLEVFILRISAYFLQMTNLRFLLVVAASAGAVFADLPDIPKEAIARKKELLFSDDFQGREPSGVWHSVVPKFEFENGVLTGAQTRDKDVPAADGRPAVKAHAAVHGLEIPTRDSVVEVKIRFEGASMIDVEFDDRTYKGSQYGHICRVQVRLNGVTLVDEREGSQRWDIRAMAEDPAKREERARLLVGRSATFPLKLETGRWYVLSVETVGDAMRASIDGTPVGYLQSAGIGHDTKSKIEFGVAGSVGLLDDVKVWNAEAAR